MIDRFTLITMNKQVVTLNAMDYGQDNVKYKYNKCVPVHLRISRVSFLGPLKMYEVFYYNYFEKASKQSCTVFRFEQY